MTYDHIKSLKVGDLFRIKSFLNLSYLENHWNYCKVIEEFDRYDPAFKDLKFIIYGKAFRNAFYCVSSLDSKIILEKLDIDEIQLLLSIE